MEAHFNGGATAILLAAKIAANGGHAGCLTLLIDAKANVDAAEDDSVSPTYMAAFNGHADCLTLLIDTKANVDAA